MQNLHKTLAWQFALIEYIVNVLSDDSAVSAKQLTHLRLCEPDGLAVRLDFKADIVRTVVYYNLFVHVLLLSFRDGYIISYLRRAIVKISLRFQGSRSWVFNAGRVTAA